MDGRANSCVCAATADVARHRPIDIFIGRLLVVLQEGDGLHDLAGLAVAALWNTNFHPRFLYWVHGRDALDGSNLGAVDILHERDAGSDRLSVLVNRAGTAQSHAAAELGPRQALNVAQIPEQGHL